MRREEGEDDLRSRVAEEAVEDSTAVDSKRAEREVEKSSRGKEDKPLQALLRRLESRS